MPGEGRDRYVSQRARCGVQALRRDFDRLRCRLHKAIAPRCGDRRIGMAYLRHAAGGIDQPTIATGSTAKCRLAVDRTTWIWRGPDGATRRPASSRPGPPPTRSRHAALPWLAHAAAGPPASSRRRRSEEWLIGSAVPQIGSRRAAFCAGYQPKKMPTPAATAKAISAARPE